MRPGAAGPGTGRDPEGDGALVAVGAALIAVAAVVWGGARLAALVTGGTLSAGASDVGPALVALVEEPGDPSAAWASDGLPGPIAYWVCTAFVAGLVTAIAIVTWRLARGSGMSRRFGVSRDASVARRRDVEPLVSGSSLPAPGRLLLGRLAPRGPVLATEDRPTPGVGSRPRRRAPNGDRGSVALIGPTRSGKSGLATGGLLSWDGPAVVLSVKRDLYDATASARAQRGEVAVFDPSGVTGLPTARWTPLRDVITTSGAARSARALAQAIPRHGVNGGDFWASHGETLISAYMALAGLSRLVPKPDGSPRKPITVDVLATWAYTHVGLKDPLVNELIRQALPADLPLETRLLARSAQVKLQAFEAEDPRIKASIYATARLAFDPWTEPAVAHSASLVPRPTYDSTEKWDEMPRPLDLDWLMEGGTSRNNTLYLTAPPTEFARLAPVLGGLLGDLREQIHAWDVAGRALPKPLLILIDEAGQLELQWLPEEVSTIAGLGGLIVTCWQSRAQIAHRYGTLADAVLAGHRSKVFFAGVDDPATLEYVTRVTGSEHVPRRSWSADTTGGRKTVSEQPQREDLVPIHVLRQMRRHDALLLHGTLPPIHLRPIPWWADQDLQRLVPPEDESGDPPQTCPLQAVDPAAGTKSGSNSGT
jgi:type IV secretion system protein VirD4